MTASTIRDAIESKADDRTPQQIMIDDTIAQLVAMRNSSIAKERYFDCLNPDHLAALNKDILNQFGSIADSFAYEAAELAGFAGNHRTTEQNRQWRFLVSDHLYDNLGSDINERVGKLRAEPAIAAE